MNFISGCFLFAEQILNNSLIIVNSSRDTHNKKTRYGTDKSNSGLVR